MEKNSNRIREEHAIELGHNKSYSDFINNLNDIWEKALFSDMDLIVEGKANGEEGFVDMLETIGLSTELLKLYIASGITSAIEYGKKREIPIAVLQDLKRKTFLQLSDSQDVDEIKEISLAFQKKLKKQYEELCMSRYSYLVKRAIELVYANKYKQISTGALAELLKCDPAYLSKVFSKETEMTVSEFIRKVKMETVLELLEHRTYSLTEISELLGYSSYAYFSKQFKKTFDVSPEEWKKRKKRVE